MDSSKLENTILFLSSELMDARNNLSIQDYVNESLRDAVREENIHSDKLSLNLVYARNLTKNLEKKTEELEKQLDEANKNFEILEKNFEESSIVWQLISDGKEDEIKILKRDLSRYDPFVGNTKLTPTQESAFDHPEYEDHHSYASDDENHVKMTPAQENAYNIKGDKL